MMDGSRLGRKKNHHRSGEDGAGTSGIRIHSSESWDLVESVGMDGAFSGHLGVTCCFK